MITDIGQGKYYLYRHIRLDKNEPFYIGVGTKQIKPSYSHTRIYRRAFSIRNRSNFWRNITNKTEYEVEIFMESNDYKFILEKEREFISLYGRRDLNSGTLVNLTNGGEKNDIRIISEETRVKMRNRKRGVLTEASKNKISIANSGRKRTKECILRTSTTKGYIKKKEDIKEYLQSLDGKPYSISHIKNLFRSNYRTIKDLIKELDMDKPYKIIRDDGMGFYTEKEACDYIGVTNGCISICIKHNWKTKGHFWHKNL